MTAPPLVSVCLPVRDGARHLDAAIASIRGQSLADLELAIVDDGSVDATPDIIARHAAADPRIVARRVACGGSAAAANAALALARGRYVARMDHDDVALADRLALTVAHLDRHPAVAVVGGAVEVIDDADRVLTVLRPPTAPAELARLLPQFNAMRHPTVLMRTDVVRALGGYRPAFDGAEDTDLWLRVLDRAQIANLPDVLLRYRRHAGQVSIRRAEEQAIASLAARSAARLRRGGAPDPVGASAALSPALLAALGLTPGMIHAEVVRRLVQGAREARALGLRDSADLLLARLRVVAAPAEILPLLMEMAGGGPRADPPQPQNC